MNKAEFCELPPGIALGIVYDLLQREIEGMPKPFVPRPPKFDGKLTRQGGFWWMSEMDLNSLVYWQGKKRESAQSGSQWAEKDQKVADLLSKWIEWRKLFPEQRWSGTRGDDRMTAAAPSREPALNKWPPRNGNGASNSNHHDSSPPPPRDEDDFGF